jgi:predicted FMN-binding regulatory protein PaiB
MRGLRPVVYPPRVFTKTRPEVLIARVERYDFALLVSHGVGADRKPYPVSC